MRFERHSYTTLPREPQLPHQPPKPTRGDFSLHHHDPYRTSAFISDDRHTDDVHHLRFAGTKLFLLSYSPKLVKVNLVRQIGALRLPSITWSTCSPARTSSPTRNFRLRRTPDYPILAPGDLLGTSLSRLVQEPLATRGHPSLDPPVPPPTPGVHALHDNIPVASENHPPANPHVPPIAPCPQLFARLEAGQRTSFLNLRDRLPPHLRDIIFDLHGSGWSPSVIHSLGDVLCKLPDVFSTSKTDFGLCYKLLY